MDRLTEIVKILRAKAESMVGDINVYVGGQDEHVMSFQMYEVAEMAKSKERRDRVVMTFDTLALPKLSPDAVVDPLAEEAMRIVMEQEGITEEQFFKAWMHNWLRNIDGFRRRIENVRRAEEVENNNAYIRMNGPMTTADGRTIMPVTMRVNGHSLRVMPNVGYRI